MGIRDRNGLPYDPLKPRIQVALVDDFLLTREAVIEAIAVADGSIDCLPFSTPAECAKHLSWKFDAILYYYRECRDSNLDDIAALRMSFPKTAIVVLCHIDMHKLGVLKAAVRRAHLNCTVLRPRTMADLLQVLPRRQTVPIATNQNFPK